MGLSSVCILCVLSRCLHFCMPAYTAAASAPGTCQRHYTNSVPSPTLDRWMQTCRNLAAAHGRTQTASKAHGQRRQRFHTSMSRTALPKGFSCPEDLLGCNILPCEGRRHSPHPLPHTLTHPAPVYKCQLPHTPPAAGAPPSHLTPPHHTCNSAAIHRNPVHLHRRCRAPRMPAASSASPSAASRAWPARPPASPQ